MKTSLVRDTVVEKVDLPSLRKLAIEFVSNRGPREILLLDGPLGAGKTQFVTFLVEAMGGKGSSSPTFTIHNSYTTPRGEIDHLDLYRLKNERELEGVGFWDLFSEPKGFIVVEWASRLDEDWMPLGWNWTRFEIKPDPNHADLRIVKKTIKI